MLKGTVIGFFSFFREKAAGNLAAFKMVRNAFAAYSLS